MTVVKVCAWCDRKVSEDKVPCRKREPGCTSAVVDTIVSHVCCKECKLAVDAEIKIYLKGIEHGKAQRVESGVN